MDSKSRAAYDMLKQTSISMIICVLYLFLSAKLEAAGQLIPALIIALTSVVMTIIILLKVRHFIKCLGDMNAG